MNRSKKKRLLLRTCGIVLALVMVLSNFTGLYPAMKALAGTCVMISAHAADPSTGSVSGDGEKVIDSDVTLTAIPNQGYEFYAWYDEYTGKTYNENPLKFKATKSWDLKVYFRKQGEHSIYLVSDSGGTVSVDPVKIGYAPGETVYLTANVNANYAFETFLLREEGQAQYRGIGNSFSMPNNDVYVGARFRSTVPHDVTIDPNMQHGTFRLLDGKTSYVEGETVRIGIRPEEGYECTEIKNIPQGFTANSNEITFPMPGYDILISGTFKKKTTFKATVYVAPSDGGTVGCDETDTGFLTVWATPNEGYAFVAYYDYTNMEKGELLSTDSDYSTQLTADVKILAVFKKLITHVAYPAGTGTTTDEYDGNTKQITVTATPNEGYVFQYWVEYPSLNVISMEPKFSFEAGTYETIVAFFKEPVTSKLYEPLPTQHGQISIVNYKTTYLEGDEIEITVTPDPGYVLENAYYGEYDSERNVLTNAHIISGNKFRMPGHDTWIGAEFVPVYNVTATASLIVGGSVTGGGTYKADETVTLTAKVNEGYEFINWTENGESVSTSKTYQFTADKDRALVANFKKKEIVYENYYSENFENWRAYEWTLVDYDGDHKFWTLEEEIDYDVSGTWSLESVARRLYIDYDPDNWAITPAIIAPKDASLSFWMYQFRTFRYKGTDTLGVYVGFSPEPGQMIKLKDFSIDTEDDRTCHVDLSDYAGQKIYIGFRHYNSKNGIVLYLDNIEVIGEMPKNVELTFKHNVEFDNNIAMHYVIPKAELDGYSNVKLVIDKEVYEEGVAVPTIQRYVLENPVPYALNGVDYWHFTFPGISASEMGNVLSAKVVCEKDGVTYESQTDVYSVKEYAYARLEKTSSASYRKVLVDMLNYGAAAQAHFKKNADNPVNTDLTDEQKAFGSSLEDFSVKKVENVISLNGATASFDAKNLVFGTNVELVYRMDFSNFKKDLPEGTTEAEKMANVKVVFKYNNGKGDKTVTVPYSQFTKNNGKYVASCSVLTPAEMGCTVNATIYDGNVPVSDTLQYSIESYVYNRLSGTGTSSETFKELLKRMVLYGKAVNEHF